VPDCLNWRAFPWHYRLPGWEIQPAGWFVLEPIQSRCAVLRYSKLTDTQLLTRLTEVCTAENVSYTDDGLEAVIFTAQGDMRQVGTFTAFPVVR